MPNTHPVIDENALGALITYLGIEDDEYGADDPSEFTLKIQQFREACIEALRRAPPAPKTHAVFLGHCFYVEVGEADDKPKLLPFVRALREQCQEKSIQTAGIVSFGGRWVLRDDEVDVDLMDGENYRLVCVSLPSEPLRKALHAEAACHDSEQVQGWGSGLYFDAEALEALGLNLKNQPTALCSPSGTFFRVGK